MCTVTYIPAGDRLLIAHSRDEKRARPRAIAPKEYTIGGQALLFPRDTLAGGSWIAVNAHGAAAVLLNGAFVKHVPAPPYRQSRGMMLLDIIASHDPLRSWERAKLQGIEPFTLLLWSNGVLCEARWDGYKKYMHHPDATQAHIWSSVTLYDEAVSVRREQWFARWRREHPQPGPEELMQFHLLGGEGNTQYDLRMNREDIMLTVSITAMELRPHGCRMKYLDLESNTAYSHQMTFTQQPIPQL